VRRALVALGVLLSFAPGVALWTVADAAATTAARGEPTEAATTSAGTARAAVTPVLSSRRVPGVVSGRTLTATVVPALRDLAARVPNGGCLAARIGDRILVERSAGAAVIPASTIKILTAAVALDRLGPEHRFTTAVVGSVVGGSATELYLVGGGDPNLTTQAYVAAGALDADGIRRSPAHPTSLETLADQVAAAGVRRIGRLVGDESAFDAERTVAAWGRSYSADTVGPLSALLVDDGLRSFRPAVLTTNPPLHAAQRFADLLRQRGVAVDATAAGAAPAGATRLASIRSAPLPDVLADTLTWSDNTSAELLLKTLGGGSTAGGVAVVRETLARWGIDGVTVADGSGLARSNVATCGALAKLLARLGPSSPVVQGLPVAGRTGTLEGAPFAGTAVEGRLLAKTGSLTEVKALAGVFVVEGAEPLQVSMVVQGPAAASTEAQLWPALAGALATYPLRDDLTVFAPVPAR
jgi:D-alanyl-D-alanine carboxypeptidase/D-alanyl-D-alanine-endopeptidase (penicillin-binding protein 4)